MIDSKYYELFKKLKRKHSSLMVYVTEHDMAAAPKDRDPLAFRGYIARRFESEHSVKITRFTHNYADFKEELGLVYLAGDSVINPGYEVWALVGHNAVGLNDQEVM